MFQFVSSNTLVYVSSTIQIPFYSILAQMAFLSMTVSIFTVVATVANNLNNNNNNVNTNNLNFVQQKQNSLSMNQNIVNQINIDLPPPIPGKR